MKKATRWIIIILALITLGVIYLPQEEVVVDNQNYINQQAVAERAERMADEAEEAMDDAEDAVEDAADDAQEALEDVEDALEEIVDEVLGEDSEDAEDENVEDTVEENDADDEAADAAVEGNTEVVIENAGYIDYSEEQFQSALEEGKDVALFFHATWCGTCSGLNADIEANAGSIGENTAIFKVDYDTATDLKERYGITRQHSIIVVDGQGNEIASDVGTPTLEELLENIASTKE